VEDLEKAVIDNDIAAFVQADFRCHATVVALLGSHHLSTTHTHLMAKLRLAIIQETASEQDRETPCLGRGTSRIGGAQGIRALAGSGKTHRLGRISRLDSIKRGRCRQLG